MTYAEAVGRLHDAGRIDLSQAAWNHYLRFIEHLSPAVHGGAIQMFDEVLNEHLKTDDPVGQEEILMSPDFAPIKALARAVQALDMPLIEADPEVVSEYELILED